MSSIISFHSFLDGDAWRYDVDGLIVGRARDRSYKEVARDGVSIDVLVAAASSPPPTTACHGDGGVTSTRIGSVKYLDEDDPILDFEHAPLRARGRHVKKRCGGLAKKYVAKAKKTASVVPTPPTQFLVCDACCDVTPGCMCDMAIAAYGGVKCDGCGADFAHPENWSSSLCCNRCPPKFKRDVAECERYIAQYDCDEDFGIVADIQEQLREERAEWRMEWRADDLW